MCSNLDDIFFLYKSKGQKFNVVLVNLSDRTSVMNCIIHLQIGWQTKPIRTKPIRTESIGAQTYRDQTCRWTNLSGQNLSGQNLSGLKPIETKPVVGQNLSGQNPSAKRTGDAPKLAILVLKTPKENRLLPQNHMQKGA